MVSTVTDDLCNRIHHTTSVFSSLIVTSSSSYVTVILSVMSWIYFESSHSTVWSSIHSWLFWMDWTILTARLVATAAIVCNRMHLLHPVNNLVRTGGLVTRTTDVTVIHRRTELCCLPGSKSISQCSDNTYRGSSQPTAESFVRPSLAKGERTLTIGFSRQLRYHMLNSTHWVGIWWLQFYM